MWKSMICISLVAGLMVVPATSRAEPSPTDVKLAEELAQQAFDAYSKGDFGAAIALYKKAYQTAPAGVILFNIANIYDKKLKDKEQALEYYRRYLRSGDTDPELVKRAVERLDIVRAEIDATKQAQADEHPTSPSAPASPPPPASTSPAGQAPLPSAPPPPPVDPLQARYRTAAMITGGVGVLGLGIGGLYAYIARSKNNQASQACPNNSCPDQSGINLDSDAHRAALVSTISSIAGVALVVGGVGLYLYAPRKENRMNNKLSIRITPQIGPQVGGLAISGLWP